MSFQFDYSFAQRFACRRFDFPKEHLVSCPSLSNVTSQITSFVSVAALSTCRGYVHDLWPFQVRLCSLTLRAGGVFVGKVYGELYE